MKSKIVLMSLCALTLSLAPLHAKDNKEKNEKKNEKKDSKEFVEVTKSYQEKAVEFFKVDFKTDGDRFKQKMTDKEIAKIYTQFFSEQDLDALLTLMKNPNWRKYQSFYDEIYYAFDDAYNEKIRNEEEKKNKAANKGKSKNKEGDYAKIDAENKEKYCASDYERQVEDILKGISRLKRACDQYPVKLDNAEDGKYDYDNKLFLYAAPNFYGNNWKKTGNQYSYECGKVKKTLNYNPKDGSFK